MTTKITEAVLGRFIDSHSRYPPFNVLINYDLTCAAIGSAEPVVVRALYAILEVLSAQLSSYHISFPELYREKEEFPESLNKTMSVPLSEAVNCGRVITEILYQFYYCMEDEMYEIRKTLQENENAIHGLTAYSRIKTRIPPPTEVDKEPDELVWAYLKGTPFVEMFNTQVPFKINKKALSEHCFIVAKPGHGKTQLLGSFATQFLNDPSKPGIFCLDPAGDWFEKLRDRVEPSRLVVLDPETNPPPLNFFSFKNSTDAESLQSFTYLMSSLSGGLSDKQSAVTPFLFKMLRRIPDASLETLRLIVDEKVKRASDSAFAAFITQLADVDQGFFRNQWFHSSMEPTKTAMSWKIYSAMSSDAFRAMFTAPENNFDAHAAMREGKVVLARGSELTLGEHGLSVFLQYIVSQFFLASLARFRIPERERRQCYLLCDEAAHIYNNQTKRVLVECRKLGLSFFSATQVIDQIPTEVKAAIYGATSVKAAGNVSFSDANLLAREMRTSAEDIQSMKTFEWMFYVADSDKAVKVRVAPGALERLPCLSAQTSEEDDLAADIAQAIWDDPEAREYVEELLAEEDAETHDGPSKPEPRAQPSKVDTTTLSQRDYAREEQEDFDACYEMAMRELTAEAEASEATIKPGRDWSEPT